MNKVIIIFLIVASGLLCGCKEWIELKEITLRSATINDENYEYKTTYRPILGPDGALPFDFTLTPEVGMYQFHIPGEVTINFIIKCHAKNFIAPKKFILHSPLISQDQLYTLSDEMWTYDIVKRIPEDCDGIAFIDGWRNYLGNNPVGLSGYLELIETTDGYNQHRFELVSDSIPQIIANGFFLTSKKIRYNEN